MKSARWIWLAPLFVMSISLRGFAHSGETHPNKASSQISQQSLEQIQASYEKNVKPIFQDSCFNCHSTKTKWPWYSQLPFISELIHSDVQEGRKHLDMTEGFPFEGHGGPQEDLTSIKEMVSSNEMPPLRYKIMHWGAFITESEEETILSWIEDSLKLLPQTESENQPHADH